MGTISNGDDSDTLYTHGYHANAVLGNPEGLMFLNFLFSCFLVVFCFLCFWVSGRGANEGCVPERCGSETEAVCDVWRMMSDVG